MSFFAYCILIPFIPCAFESAPPPTNKTKQNSRKRRKKIKWKKNRNKIKKSCHGSCSATQRATPRGPLSVHLCLQVSLQRVIGLGRGPYWAPNLHGQPAAARSCRDPASFGSAGQVPSHAPADHTWGGCWDRARHNPGSGPGCRVDPQDGK